MLAMGLAEIDMLVAPLVEGIRMHRGS
jgi:hypothetical protein